LKWLVLEGYAVVCYLADVGQEDAADADVIKKKALLLGAERMIISDLQKVFVEQVSELSVESTEFPLSSSEKIHCCVSHDSAPFPICSLVHETFLVITL